MVSDMQIKILCFPRKISERISAIKRLILVYNESKWFFMAPKYHLKESVKWQIIGRLEARQAIT